MSFFSRNLERPALSPFLRPFINTVWALWKFQLGNMQSQLLSDIKLKGNILIRQLCSKEMNKQTNKKKKQKTWTRGKEREKTLKGTSQRAGMRYRSRKPKSKYKTLNGLSASGQCSFSPLHVILSVILSYTQFVYVFIMKRLWKSKVLFQTFFLHLMRWSGLLHFIICRCLIILASLE